MKRLTTDTPDGNFETVLNFVYGKDGWAYIRHDGEHENIPLTAWAREQCLRHGCDEFSAEMPEEIDQEICDCMMECPGCPVALAYCFASQAVHLRSRLKMYEDTDRMPDEISALQDPPNDPLTLEELREMDDVDLAMLEIKIMPENGQFRICECSNGEFLIGLKSLPISEYGETWLACRRKPEEEAEHDV